MADKTNRFLDRLVFKPKANMESPGELDTMFYRTLKNTFSKEEITETTGGTSTSIPTQTKRAIVFGIRVIALNNNHN